MSRVEQHLTIVYTFQLWTPSVEMLLVSFCRKYFKRRGGTAHLCLIVVPTGQEESTTVLLECTLTKEFMQEKTHA
jgi:hypothetical protein